MAGDDGERDGDRPGIAGAGPLELARAREELVEQDRAEPGEALTRGAATAGVGQRQLEGGPDRRSVGVLGAHERPGYDGRVPGRSADGDGAAAMAAASSSRFLHH